MATPPPEAASFAKEKPLFPPSPNGAPAKLGDTGIINPAIGAMTSIPANGAGGDSFPSESKSTPANGTFTGQPSFTNGVNTTASPPKSPAVSAADAVLPASLTKETKLESARDGLKIKEDPLTEEQRCDHMELEDSKAGITMEGKAPTTSIIEDVTPGGVTSNSADSGSTPAENKTSDSMTAVDVTSRATATLDSMQDEITSRSEPFSTEPSQGITMETVPSASCEFSAVAELSRDNATRPNVETTLRNGVADSKTHDSSLQSTDQDLMDTSQIPMAPTKLSREREVDGTEEPAAKRVRVEDSDISPFDFKAAELATPTAKLPAEGSVGKKSGISKLQFKFLVKGINGLKRLQSARFYREPVDPVKLNIPHYHEVIKRPMDLGTIDRKLKNDEYHTAQAVTDDFNLMVHNSATFNGLDHIVTQEGQNLKAAFDKLMLKLPHPSEIEEKKKPKKAPQKASAARRELRTGTGQSVVRPTGPSPQVTTFALGPEGLPLIRRDSTNLDGRPKRSIHPPKRDLPYSTKPKKKKYQWELRFCQETLDELHKAKHYIYAAPFYDPVDPVALNIPTYHSVIKTPMDLSTMQSKLRTGQYENAKEFEADMRLMFKNCYRFNLPGDPTFNAGQQLESVFNDKWAGKKRYLEVHEPPVEQQSASSSEEDSDEGAEDSDDEYEAQTLTTLQKQMAELSRQMEAISQKKKKTPPGSKRANKQKLGKKDAKDSKKNRSTGFNKKDKKSKPLKPEKERWVSYHEKQIISNGISNLPDRKMQEALKIIQSNVPSLKGTQETEIELDIDELPNEVLLMLLKFVKKNAPHVMEDEDIEPPMVNAVVPKPKKNKPMSKFEQEAQINMLESNLSRFQRGGRSPNAMPSVEANDSSDDSDDVTEESEEE